MHLRRVDLAGKLAVVTAGIVSLAGCVGLAFMPDRMYDGEDRPDVRIATVLPARAVVAGRELWVARISAVDGIPCTRTIMTDPPYCNPVQVLSGKHTFSAYLRTDNSFAGSVTTWKVTKPFEVTDVPAFREGYFYFVVADFAPDGAPRAKIVEMCRSAEHISLAKEFLFGGRKECPPDVPAP